MNPLARQARSAGFDPQAPHCNGRVVELEDTLGLGPSALNKRAGSTPVSPTTTWSDVTLAAAPVSRSFLLWLADGSAKAKTRVFVQRITKSA